MAAAVGLFVLNHLLVALKSDRLTPFLFVTYKKKNKYNIYNIGSVIDCIPIHLKIVFEIQYKVLVILKQNV